MTAHGGNICFVSRECQCLDLDSWETKQIVPEGAALSVL